jgi:signal transduction histidine kinase
VIAANHRDLIQSQTNRLRMRVKGNNRTVLRYQTHGMGMGLAVARTIVEAHDGQITAENGRSGGAVFRIKLPLAR